MFPPNPGSASSAPLPPLPEPQFAGAQQSGGGGGLSSIMSGLMPVKQGVDMILQACKMIVQSGAVPGAEQPCSQIVQLATSLLPMAAQAAMQPGVGSGGIPPVGGGGQGPQPILGGGQ